MYNQRIPATTRAVELRDIACNIKDCIITRRIILRHHARRMSCLLGTPVKLHTPYEPLSTRPLGWCVRPCPCCPRDDRACATSPTHAARHTSVHASVAAPPPSDDAASMSAPPSPPPDCFARLAGDGKTAPPAPPRTLLYRSPRLSLGSAPASRQ
eukprot:2250530-Pyramimonas_sp.AAC.1